MKNIPHVSKYMSTSPHSVGADQSLQVASELMAKHKIRHLPVLEGGKLTGLLSDRDVKLYLSFTGVDIKKQNAGEVADREVYTVSPEALLDEVTGHMAERKLGSAVVMDNKKVVGIFTSVDAMRALAELLSTKLKK